MMTEVSTIIGAQSTVRPVVTVAAVVERGGKLLCVEERTREGIQVNQPAGHVEPGEGIVHATVRETLEETAFHVRPVYLVGVYRWRRRRDGREYLRFALAAEVEGHEPQRPLDEGILRATWLSPEALHACVERHRSPLVWMCVADYLAGRRFPLDVFRDVL